MTFKDFVLMYQDMVYSTALRIVGSLQEAEDIAQQVFLKAYGSFSQLQGNSSAGGWLRVVARNLSINYYNRHLKRWRFLSLSFLDAEAYEETNPDESDDPRFMNRTEVLKTVLLSIPAKYRVPLVLFHYEAMSYEMIASQLAVPVSKIKTDIHRGRMLIRKEILKIEERQ